MINRMKFKILLIYDGYGTYTFYQLLHMLLFTPFIIRLLYIFT